jgi:hypothetical protein
MTIRGWKVATIPVAATSTMAAPPDNPRRTARRISIGGVGRNCTSTGTGASTTWDIPYPLS